MYIDRRRFVYRLAVYVYRSAVYVYRSAVYVYRSAVYVYRFAVLGGFCHSDQELCELVRTRMYADRQCMYTGLRGLACRVAGSRVLALALGQAQFVRDELGV